ncbi:MAG: aminodeoxychorismate synthase, component I [Chromatiales bacterium]|jgi:anthranilate synthase component 1|nr:aminodeoxychorismate synthase, component I [Chromatiales bacterium]MDP6151476.1 aminodeoxychorismate synthase component I [Gammaproteobacteria bacterium]MDP7093607.1 aminodeoxychorismate synthase component I [Gammaproteobacteria bacterium]MDP7270137.1 aminodeoxychorismate synthase component I [Gammaproteobacteria bacterium]HJP03809.1 aminodeoxychorismate synthase component I [Gammaproteobacteria bacterium]
MVNTAADRYSQSRSGAYSISRRGGYADLTGLSRLNPDRYPYLLQSVASAPSLARFDILFAFPGETLSLRQPGDLSGPESFITGTFLGSLDRWWASELRNWAGPGEELAHLPFTGGWFVYLGYELATEVEPGLRLKTDPSLPVAFATRIAAAMIVDHERQEIVAVAEASHTHLISSMWADLDAVTDAAPASMSAGVVHEDDPGHFIAAVNKAQAYIRAGDIFQANLSRRWRSELQPGVQAVDIYARLRETNPAPFAGLVQHPDFDLLSSSPERLVRKTGRRIDTRPIAGTRPRTEAPEQLEARKLELLTHPKERAEHIMLIDLERNDLGRVCVGGSVNVDEHMVVESYSHVHHIVSNVTGIARPDLTPGQLIRAVFPGGTITGCPKVRCMEIIKELEDTPRNAYTGSMGYLNLNGDCDLNILIRSLVVRGSQIELAAGSGIVADSDPQAELEETRAKAKGMLLALDSQRDRA